MRFPDLDRLATDRVDKKMSCSIFAKFKFLRKFQENSPNFNIYNPCCQNVSLFSYIFASDFAHVTLWESKFESIFSRF